MGPDMGTATRLGVVTDSTACFPSGYVEALGLKLSRDSDGHADIVVVPLDVIRDGKAYSEGVDFGVDEVTDALNRRVRLTTSRPSPSRFAAAYAALAEAGCDRIVSVHLSAQLSGTYEAASLAARNTSVPVAVVDSRTIGMGLGFACVSAARGQMDLDAATSHVRDLCKRSATVFYVDSLEYLKRGGRIGGAAALLGSALRIKPILQVDDGRVEPLEKARTTTRALARLVSIAEERAASRDSVRIAVAHVAAGERASSVMDELDLRLGGRGIPNEIVAAPMSAVIAAHIGPGALSVSIVDGEVQ